MESSRSKVYIFLDSMKFEILNYCELNLIGTFDSPDRRIWREHIVSIYHQTIDVFYIYGSESDEF